MSDIDCYIHYDGEVVRDEMNVFYMGGEARVARDIDPDRMSYVNLRIILYSLGYKHVKTIWRSLESDMEKGCCEIRNDKELMCLILQKEEGGRVDFFVEHCDTDFNPSDDTIDVSAIDMDSFPRAEEWLELVTDSTAHIAAPSPAQVVAQSSAPSPAQSPAPSAAQGPAPIPSPTPSIIPAQGEDLIASVPSTGVLEQFQAEGIQSEAFDAGCAADLNRKDRYEEDLSISDDQDFIPDEAEINASDDHFSPEDDDLSSDFRESNDDDDDDLFSENVDFTEPSASAHHFSEQVSGLGEELDAQIPDPDYDSDHLETLVNSEDEGGVPRQRVREFNPETDYSKKLSLQVGDLFPNYKEFKQFLKEYCIVEGFDFKFSKNEPHRIVAKCKGANCQWSVRASDCSKSGGFKVKTMTEEHNCVRDYNNQRVTYHWLAKKYKEHIRDDPSWLVSAFQKDVLRTVKVKVNKQKCYRARRKCIQELYGKDVEQFAIVRDYATALLNASPGSSAIVDVDDNKFRRFYVCLEACKRGFVETCRPLIAVDGCHLKGPFGGQLLVAVGKDANDNMYPIAWAAVEIENKDSWKWFLSWLLDDIGSVEEHGWNFISDQQKGLLEAFKEILPGSFLRICVRHLYSNFKLQFKGKELKDLLWGAARATTERQHQYYMEKIKALNVQAFEWLDSKDKSTWCRHAFAPRTKSDTLLSNIAECFNSWILEAREKPIITMFEIIRRQIMKRFVAKREGMRKYEGIICPRIQLKLNVAKLEAHDCIVYADGADRFEIDHISGAQFIVDLKEKSCSCRRWNLTGIPYGHGCAAIFDNKELPESYVDPYYHKLTLAKAYEPVVHVMPGPPWPDCGLNKPLPPTVKAPSGRPKKLRRRDDDEPLNLSQNNRGGHSIKCGSCGKSGHNVKTCKEGCSNPKRAAQYKREAERAKKIKMKKKAEVGRPQTRSRAKSAADHPSCSQDETINQPVHSQVRDNTDQSQSSRTGAIQRNSGVHGYVDNDIPRSASQPIGKSRFEARQWGN